MSNINIPVYNAVIILLQWKISFLPCNYTLFSRIIETEVAIRSSFDVPFFVFFSCLTVNGQNVRSFTFILYRDLLNLLIPNIFLDIFLLLK
jgi:hypothetical protein